MADRRRFPRIQANVVCRPAGSELFHHRRNTQDVSLGGIRVYSDEDFPVGTRLDLDVLLPDQTSVRCWAVVVWRSEMSDGAVARYDVGLRFTDMSPADIQRLTTVLVQAR